jgi:hypothetical protein
MPDNPNLARAWKAMAWAILIHVLDEAWNNFLVVYNPVAMEIADRYPWLPVPIFRFEYWLGGLLLGVLILMALTPVARRGSHGIILAARILSAFMIVNGLGHIAATIAGRTPFGVEFARPMPGFWSSLVLIPVAIWLWRAASATRQPVAAA